MITKQIKVRFYDWVPLKGGWTSIMGNQIMVVPSEPDGSPPQQLKRVEAEFSIIEELVAVKEVKYNIAGKVEDWGSENPVYAYHREYR